MGKLAITKYKAEIGECPFDTFIEQLRKDGKLKEIKKIQHHILMLEEFGFSLPGINDTAKRLEGNIYELRPMPNRVLYYYCDKNGKYVLFTYLKKDSPKTPREEIEKAKREVSDYERMNRNGK